jgi:hypothetical protein
MDNFILDPPLFTAKPPCDKGFSYRARFFDPALFIAVNVIRAVINSNVLYRLPPNIDAKRLFAMYT